MKNLIKVLPVVIAVVVAIILFFQVGVSDPYKLIVAAIAAAVTTHYGLFLRHLKVSVEVTPVIGVAIAIDRRYRNIALILPGVVIEFDYFFLINRKK